MRKMTVLGFVLLLFSVLGFGQNGRGIAGYCPYGCGPYVPLLTTPSLTWATVSPNPVGARNATGGLVAGATNSTLSEVSVNTDAVYTMPVWYSGGQTPIISPTAPAARTFAPERRMRRDESEMESGRETRLEMHGEEAAAPQAWTYYNAGKAHTARTYSNDDVTRQSQQNGLVKHGGKTEKIQ